MSVEDMSVFSCTAARRRVRTLGHRVEAARVEGLATAKPQQRQPTAAQRAVYADGFHPVFRAAGNKTAARPEQGADEALVEAQYGNE
ncbi:hypothetical protein D3C71_1699550 [compost metagenome]